MGIESEKSALWIEEELRGKFVSEATVTNARKKYISIPSVNQRINVEMQGWAADLIVNHYKNIGKEFNSVVGVPYSGISLATSVAERLKIPLAPGRKGKDFPGAWQNPIKVEETVASFTTGVKNNFVFNGVEEGDSVLLVEDVIATGDTLRAIIKAMQSKGIKTEVAAYFAKIFQGGIKKIENLGIRPFYAIGIEDIKKDSKEWKVNLSPLHFPQS